MAKMYAKIQYAELLVPLDLLEKLVAQGYIASTSYESGSEHLSELKPIRKVELFSEADVKACLAQMALEGKD